MIPKYRSTLYTGRVLQCYIVLSLVLLIILLLFYAMFLMLAVSLNRNARLQHENHLLSLQQERYKNLCMAIEEARQARHDIRHHFVQLSALAEQGDMEKIKKYLLAATGKISDYNLHFCENQAVDSVFGYYSALAKRENIPFHALVSLPADLSIDEIDLCLVFSNLLENALEASLRTAPGRRQIEITACVHADRILLIEVENAFDGEVNEKNGVFRSSKRRENGIGIQSVTRIAEKTGGLRPEYNGAQDYDYIFRCTEMAGKIVHIPRVLYHWRVHSASTADNPASKLYAYEAGKKAIEGNLARCGEEGTVTLRSDYGFYDVDYKLRGTPLVSILIPNKDQADTLRTCLESIKKKCMYPSYEILIIENNSTEEATFSYYKELEAQGIRVLKYPKQGFNYSAINNFGVKEAKGEYLLSLIHI